MHLLQFAWVPTVVAPKVQSLGALLGRALFEQAPVKHARQRQARGECLALLARQSLDFGKAAG